MENRTANDFEDAATLWHKCSHCQEFTFKNELERNLYICSHCGALFPLLAEKRLDHLVDDASSLNTKSTEESGLIAEATISGYPACLFIADIDVIPEDINASFFLSAVEMCLQKRIPLVTIAACQPSMPDAPLIETTYLNLQIQQLTDAALPHITVLTETDTAPLALSLPVGQLVIAEGVDRKKVARPNLQPALHAPEEQLLTQPSPSEGEADPDLSVDCYVGREELPSRLGLFLKFFQEH